MENNYGFFFTKVLNSAVKMMDSTTNLPAFKPAVLGVVVNFAISGETNVITPTIQKQLRKVITLRETYNLI